MIEIKGHLYCGLLNQITVLDSRFNRVKSVNTKMQPIKLLQIKEEYLMVGQTWGYLQIISLQTLKTSLKTGLSQKKVIYDMIKTQNTNEYAFALGDQNGLVFATIKKNQFTEFRLRENTNESYLFGIPIISLALLKSNSIIACTFGNGLNNLQIINRTLKQITKQIQVTNKPLSFPLMILPMLDFDDKCLPYMLVRDSDKISVINVLNTECDKIIECKDYFCYSY